MNDNKKIRAPKVAITRAMVEAGKGTLDALISVDTEDANISDDQLVAQIFYSMWNVYWEEVMAEKRKKKAGSPIIKPSGIILPQRH